MAICDRWRSTPLLEGYSFSVKISLRDGVIWKDSGTITLPPRHHLLPDTGEMILMVKPGEQFRITVTNTAKKDAAVELIVNGVKASNCAAFFEPWVPRTYEG